VLLVDKLSKLDHLLVDLRGHHFGQPPMLLVRLFALELQLMDHLLVMLLYTYLFM